MFLRDVQITVLVEGNTCGIRELPRTPAVASPGCQPLAFSAEVDDPVIVLIGDKEIPRPIYSHRDR